METKNPVYTLDQDTLRMLTARGWDEQKLGFSDRWNAAAAERERDLLDRINTTYAAMTRLGMLVQQDSVTLYNARALRAPISRVPDDVLRIIFEDKADILQRGSSLPFQVVCSRVCRRWRRIAFETAYLWSRIAVGDARSLSFASRYLTQGCPTAPIELELTLKCSFSRVRETLMKKLVDFLSTYAPRLSRLRLDMCEHSVTQVWGVVTSEFPVLETVTLRLQYFYCKAQIELKTNWNGEGLLLRASAIHRLRLTSCDVPTNLVSLPAISSLALEFVTGLPDDLKNFFSSFPNIHKLRLERVSFYRQSENHAASNAPVTLNRLHTLELLNCLPDNGWQPFFLHAPNLKQFAFSNHGSLQEILAVLKQQVGLTHVSLSLGWTHAQEVIAALANPIGGAPTMLPLLANLRVVSIEQHASNPDRGRYAGSPWTLMNDILCSSLMDMVRTRSNLGIPLPHLSVCPKPDEKKAKWFRSKLHGQSDTAYYP